MPASTYGLETLALAELHQHKLQVCENNWIRRIAGVKRVERRRQLSQRRSWNRSKACIVGKIVKSRMKWAGHMVRMKDDKLPKRSETKKQEGFRKRGRPQLRWEDCVKRDLRKAEEEEKWRENANNRDQWKQITKVAVDGSTSEWPVDQPHPYTREPEEEQPLLAPYYTGNTLWQILLLACTPCTHTNPHMHTHVHAHTRTRTHTHAH